MRADYQLVMAIITLKEVMDCRKAGGKHQGGTARRLLRIHCWLFLSNW